MKYPYIACPHCESQMLNPTLEDGMLHFVCECGCEVWYDDEYYDPIEEETEEDYITCKVCGVLITGYGACYNCGYDPENCEPGDFEEDWTHHSDKPYKEEE